MNGIELSGSHLSGKVLMSEVFQRTISAISVRVFDASLGPILLERFFHKNLSLGMQNAIKFWHTLAPEFQRNIFYFQGNGEWYANIAGHAISMQYETAEKTNKEEGVYVGDRATYFSFDAAERRALEKHAIIPDDTMWQSMQTAVGGWENLRQVLAIEYDGYYSTWPVRRGDENGITFEPGVILQGPGGRHVILGSGSVVIPYTLEKGKKIPQKKTPQYSYVFFTECRPDAQRIHFQKSDIYRDSRSPKIYWHCLRLAYR